MSQIVDELPEGWASCCMADVSEIVGGGTPKASDEANFADDGHPWLTPADLSDFRGVYISRGRRCLSDQGLKSCSAKMMPKGAVLMSSRAPIGYVAVAQNEICTNQGFKSFVLRDGLAPEFVCYWLKSIRGLLEEMGSGTTFAEISGARAKEIPLCFPPLPEQQRIVAKVEELLARVNAAREHLAKAPAILKRLRQSVLAAACSGRLTGVENIPTCLLGDLVVGGPQNGLYKPSEHYGTGCLILRIANFYDGDIRPWRELDRLRLTAKEKSSYALAPGDIVVNRVNSMQFLGKSALVRNLPEPCVFESNMMRIRVDLGRVLPEYLIRYLNCSVGLAELRKNAKHAVNQSSINQTDVASTKVPLPTLEEQREIVRRVESLFRLADEVERRAAAASARADRLTQAILAKAFRGELVPTEAELARREGREYETASKLLERIATP